MNARKGEKIGWTAGWLGGFLWVAILSVVFLVQHEWGAGIAGLAVVALAVALIAAMAPWRHPSAPYWKLMAPLLGAVLASIAWAVWAYGGPAAIGADWWTVLWFVPILVPMGTAGRRRWSDGAFEREERKEGLNGK